MSCRVLVTGGASFIGSHIVELLLARGDNVTVVDDFSSGSLENLEDIHEDILILRHDLRNYQSARRAVRGADVVYHLAADHGGRGYVETRQLNCAHNFSIDQNILRACRCAGTVERIVFASSGCIYPLHLQGDVRQSLYLSESDAGPPYAPDGLYGLAKLVCELTLEQLWREAGIKSSTCRFFTVYGPRAKENHAIMAMIARSFIRQDPFEIWGDGSQIRNWTFVDDIAGGMVASEKLLEAAGYTVVNLGTMERIAVLDAVQYICELAGYRPMLKFLLDKPVGPLNRVADNSVMVSSLGLEPVPFRVGVQETFDWYYRTKDLSYIKQNLERLLVERK